MSARKSFQSKAKKSGTRFYDENLIAREQLNFTGGVYNDLAVTPKNSLPYLVNAIPMADGIVSRTGTSLFGSFSAMFLNSSMQASKYGTTITVSDTGGYNFSSSDIGRYFIGPDGFCDVITDVSGVSSNVSLTVQRSSNYNSTSGCKLRGELCCMQWSQQARKWVMQFDTRVFIANWNFSIVNRAYFVGNPTQEITESPTRVGFRYGQPLLFNSNGIYGINISKPLPYYYKYNTLGPQNRAADIESSSTLVYGRRYLRTYSILDSTGQANNGTQITRLTPNVEIEHESSPDILANDGEGNLIDYTEQYTQYPIGPFDSTPPSGPIVSEPNVLNLYAPPDPHWLYHSIWATMDVGVNGIANGNLNTRFYFVKDIPITKALIVHGVASPNTVVADSGTFSDDDIGSTLLLEQAVSGHGSVLITGVIDAQTITTSPSIGTTGFGQIGASIGSAKVNRGYNNSTQIIVNSAGGSSFSLSDVGKIVFWDDGTWDIITGYVNAHTVTFLNISGQSRGDYQGIAWVAANRNFNDTITDDTLANSRAGYLLPHRFFTPMPNANLGIIAPGYVAVAQTNSDMLYYCQTLYPQLIGCYNPGLQYDEVDCNISELSQFPDYIVAYGSKLPGWMWSIPASQTVSDQTVNAVGESINILATRTPILGMFGILTNSVKKDENGNDICLTTQKELRVFNGTSFGENLLIERLMNRVSKLQNAVAARYDTFNGYIFEGTETATI